MPWEAGLQWPGVWICCVSLHSCAAAGGTHTETRAQGTKPAARCSPRAAHVCASLLPRGNTPKARGLCPHENASVPTSRQGWTHGVSLRAPLLHMCMRMCELCVRTRVHKVWHRHAHMFGLRACARTEAPHPTLAMAVWWWRWSGHLGNAELGQPCFKRKKKKKIKPLNTKKRRSWRVVRVRRSPRLRSRLPPQPGPPVPTQRGLPQPGHRSQDPVGGQPLVWGVPSESRGAHQGWQQSGTGWAPHSTDSPSPGRGHPRHQALCRPGDAGPSRTQSPSLDS